MNIFSYSLLHLLEHLM